MIRPLRRAHRLVAVLLALALVAIVAGGLAARRPVPPMGALPANLDGHAR